MLNLPVFTSHHIVVFGDVMLDQYWHGETRRISPEAPVPVVRVNKQETRAGGAANVALNIRALGADVTLLGVTGEDAAADDLQAQLSAKGVQCDFQRLQTAPTITKLRVLSRHQQLIRLDFEETLHGLDAPALQVALQTHVARSQALILSDYGKGTLGTPRHAIEMARSIGLPVLVDPKGQDFSQYRGATLLTPNLSEFEMVVGRCADEADIVAKGVVLRDSLDLEALLITRSEQGMTLLQKNQPALHLPAHAQEVFDVTGAGDTVIGVLATALAAGESLANATRWANLAASLVVVKLGADCVLPAELQAAAHAESGNVQRGIYQQITPLQQAVQAAQARGERVVMTNGCFDILHAGHVQYLQQARALGDHLIIAVNDDASVRRLKGKSRPINPLAERMAVLVALGAVDWVVPFSSNTPQDLICQLLPDILVKGGDYEIEQIAGHECVQNHGGTVQILEFLDGCSTTRVVNAIQAGS